MWLQTVGSNPVSNPREVGEQIVILNMTETFTTVGELKWLKNVRELEWDL